MNSIVVVDNPFYVVRKLTFQDDSFCIWQLSVTCNDRSDKFSFYFAKLSGVKSFLSKYKPVHSFNFWYSVYSPIHSFSSAYYIASTIFGSLSFVL